MKAVRGTGGGAADQPGRGRPDGHFGTEGLRGNLRQRSVRAGAANVASQLAANGVNLLATVVLARLLTPADFGLVAMVTVITGFTIMLRDLGLSSATIQREDINQVQVSTLLWVNAAAGALLTLVIVALAPTIAGFYGRPELVRVTLVLATLSVLDGLAVQHQALLRRQLRMGALAGIDLAAQVAGVVSAIWLAVNGIGYWSLVVMQMVTMVLRTALSWIVSGWRPSLVLDFGEVRSMLAFGSQLTVARMVNYVARNVDKLLIGKIWSAQDLGIYSKAFAGSVLPFQKAVISLSRVAVPTLSRLQQEPARFRSYYQTAVLLLATCALPVTAAVMLEAAAAVRIVLGDQWLAMVPLLMILAPLALMELLGGSVRWTLVSLGRGGRLLRWRILESAAKVTAILIGIRWGIMGIAWALLVVNGLIALPALRYCFADSPVRPVDIAAVIWKPLAAVLAAAGAVAALRAAGITGVHLVADTIVELTVLGIVYLAAWLVLPGGRATLRHLAGLAAELRSGNARRGAGPDAAG